MRNKILIGLGVLATLVGGVLFANHKPKLQIIGTWPPITTTTLKEEIVEYRFVSDKLAEATPYWDKNNSSQLSNAEVLPTNANGQTPIAFYAAPIFFKENGNVYEVETATATRSEFDKLAKPNLLSRIRSYLVDTAIATTSFTGSGTYTPDAVGTITILVVGGGGGGSSGGAGAGGYNYSTSTAVVIQTYTVTVGTGGAGANANTTNGAPGVDSVFSGSGFTSVTGTGGGFGHFADSGAGGNGGSGGGGGAWGGGTTTGGTGSQGQNGGGNGGFIGAPYPAGGGGGASVAGANASADNVAGDGGAGTANTITGSSVTYAGGGGAATYLGTGTQGLGGAGGGGNAGANGTDNTGGGGGGHSIPGTGGTGGSGIIIIAFNSTTAASAIKPGIIIFE